MAAPGRQKMHEGEAAIDAELVGRLLAAQFPRLAGLPVSEVRSTGTVNVIFRLGGRLCVRLPRLRSYAAEIGREWHCLPRLAPHLPLQIPEPVAPGQPGSGYPFPWAIYRWIEGRPYADDLVVGERQAATGLARFVAQLRQAGEIAGAPRAGREPLRELGASTREAIGSANGAIDGPAAIAAWERALQAPAWDGTPVWIHSDLLRPSLPRGRRPPARRHRLRQRRYR